MSPSTSPPGRQPDPPATVVGRVFAILRAFGPEDVLGASDLARATGLPRSTVHRIAADLVAERALTRVGDKYRPALGLFELGVNAQPSRLRDAIIPYLEDLQRVTGGDVQLAALDGTDVVFLDHVPARGSTAQDVHLGGRLPAHAAAAGKALLAFDQRASIDPSRALEAVTHRTVTDHAALRDELDAIRRRGWAMDTEEAELGRVGVGVPVKNRHGRVLAALSVTAAIGAMDTPRVVDMAQMVARTITRVAKGVNVAYLARARPP